MSEKVQLTLTDRAAANAELALLLKQHTETRTYLKAVLENKYELPELKLTSLSGDFNPDVLDKLELSELPKDVIDMLLISLVEQAERQVITLWDDILENAEGACKSIKIMLARRKSNITTIEDTADDEEPDIIPFSGDTDDEED
jgi:hypothetical protein